MAIIIHVSSFSGSILFALFSFVCCLVVCSFVFFFPNIVIGFIDILLELTSVI